MNKNSQISWMFPLLFVMYEISLYLSNDMYLPALPSIIKDLNISTTHAQLTVTTWFLGSACTPLVMGAITDRFGRRPTLLIGGLIYIAATVLCALAINEYTLLVPRIFQGAMISSMMVAGYAVIHELYEHKMAIRILAVMGGISVLAPALGPLFGAFILLFAEWRMIFWFIALYAGMMLLCLYIFMPETLPSNKRHALHLGTLIHNYWKIITSKNFITLIAILGLTFAGFISWVTAGPILIIDDLHYSEVAYGWMQAAVFGSYILGSRLASKRAEHVDANLLVNQGLSISFISGILLSLAAYMLPDNFYLYLIIILFYSFGSALCFAPLNRLIIETSEQPMGLRVACFTTGLMVCGVLGSGVASVVYNGTSLSLSIIITVGIIFASFLRVLQYKYQ